MSSKFLDKTGLDTLWAKIKSTFQTLGNLVTTSTGWGSTPSDTKYPSEKLVKTALDAKAPNAPSEVTIATGDKPLIADSSDGSKVKRANITFDTGVSTTYLCRNGTFNAVKERDIFWGGIFRTIKSPTETFTKQNSFFYPKPSAVSVEYSNNRTAENPTWTDYGLTDNDKRALFSGNEGAVHVYCGKKQHVHPGYTGSAPYKDLSNENIADQGLRITIACRSLSNRTTDTDNWIYCYIRGILLEMSTQSAGDGTHCVIEKQNGVQYKANSDEWVTLGDYKIQGDIGWNSIPYDGAFGGGWSQTSNYSWVIRFTIWSDKLSASPNSGQTGCLSIRTIAAINSIVWSATNPVQKTGFPFYYGYDGTMTLMRALPLGSGGTGKTSVTAGNYLVGNGTSALTEKTPNVAANDLINALTTGESTPTDNDYYVAQYAGGGTTTKTFHRRPVKALWEYIKAKISSVLGLTATSYGGNAATATTAAGYTSGGAIDTALHGKVDTAEGKRLSTNDFTDTYKSNVDSNTSARHTHSNKSVLDGISSGDITNWNAAEPNVQSDWNQTTTTADDYIKNKPQNLVQDASYVHTDNNYTTTEKNKLASAVQPGDLGTAAYKNVPKSGDASTTQVVMGSDSRLTRSVWSGGSTAVCGYKICTTSQIAGKSGQTSNIYAIVMGSMCLTNKYAAQPQGSDSAGVNGALAMGSFMIWCEGEPNGTITARARLFSSDAAFNNADIALCKKYVNGAVEWFVAFGPWDSSKAVTTSRSFGMSVCFDYVQNVNIPDTLEAVPSGYGYEDYYSLWKHPYLQSTNQGAGSSTRPVYVTANGEIKECTSVNADTVDGFHFSTSTSGSATNTVYLV